uniref:Right handed beta helix domain-containing protein n=1 Tax=Amphimedon queenslandica TaxID=400682 RepID=A0A1X7VM81_AMPQE
MSLFLHFFFAVFVFVSSPRALAIPQAKVINITKSNELEQFLCNNSNSISQDTIVVLSTNITHYISSDVSICSINTTYSLNLAGNTTRMATIHCNGSENGQPNTGFAFINTHSLTLRRILFEGCGGYLRNSSITGIINSTNSSVYFSHTHSAVLVFLCNKRLVLDYIIIAKYYGFAILAINPMDATINDLFVSSSSSASSTGISIGSGVMFFFTDELPTNDCLHNVTVRYAAIFFNIEYILGVGCLGDLRNTPPRKPFPVINAAGFTILYTQHNFESKVYIQDLIFIQNIGTMSGAMLIFHYGTSRGKTTLNHIDFGHENVIDEEKCQAYGSRLAFVMMNVPPSHISPLLVENSYFIAKKNDFFDSRGSGSVFIGIYWPINFQPTNFSSMNISVAFRNVVFHGNSIRTTGACLYAREYFYDDRAPFGALSILLENITAHDNSHTSILGINSGVGIFSIFNAKELNIAGVNHFNDNYGSVFEVAKTRINLLAGSLNFRNNKGEKGPAFKLTDSSHFYLANGLNATFINNSALTKGGAIFAYNELSETCTFNPLQRQEATMLTNWSSISLTFINNNAHESGSSIFSSNLYKCYTDGESKDASYLLSLYNKIFRFESKSHLNNMSTPPNSVVKPTYDKPVYPGQIMTLNLSACYVSKPYKGCPMSLGLRQYAVATFTLNYHVTRKYDRHRLLPSWHIAPNDVNQALMESTSHTIVQLRLLKKNDVPEPFNSAVQLFVMSTIHGSFSTHSDLSLILHKGNVSVLSYYISLNFT